jgi:hypothetical protein
MAGFEGARMVALLCNKAVMDPHVYYHIAVLAAHKSASRQPHHLEQATHRLAKLEQAGFLRDIFANPFRPAAFDPAWRTPIVRRLAEAIYDERAFDRLPILADALEEAGCANADILSHLRGPGPHVQGCWVLDLVLGKE